MLTELELKQIRDLWKPRKKGLVVGHATSVIPMLLDHIAELESILRDMQDDSLAYREGVKEGLRLAMDMIAEDHQTWGKRLPGISEEEARAARFALNSLLAAVEEKYKLEDSK